MNCIYCTTPIKPSTIAESECFSCKVIKGALNVSIQMIGQMRGSKKSKEYWMRPIIDMYAGLIKLDL